MKAVGCMDLNKCLYMGQDLVPCHVITCLGLSKAVRDKSIVLFDP